MEQKSEFESFELDVNSEIKAYLKEIYKWSYFLSIIGFIGISLMLLGGFFMAFMRNNFDGLGTAYGLGYSMGIGLVYVVFALVYFFPVLYLFKFSSKMKIALNLNNNKDFRLAFLNLKSHYKYMGIFAIVIISLYVLFFIITISSAAFI